MREVQLDSQNYAEESVFMVEYRIFFCGGRGGGGGGGEENFDMEYFHAIHALLGDLGACFPRKTRCSETEF